MNKMRSVHVRILVKAGFGCGASNRFVHPEDLRGLVCCSAAAPGWRCCRGRRRARWSAGERSGALWLICGFPNSFAARAPWRPRAGQGDAAVAPRWRSSCVQQSRAATFNRERAAKKTLDGHFFDGGAGFRLLKRGATRLSAHYVFPVGALQHLPCASRDGGRLGRRCSRMRRRGLPVVRAAAPRWRCRRVRRWGSLVVRQLVCRAGGCATVVQQARMAARAC